MKVLVIQPKICMGDMVIYLPYIHAISKKYQTPVSILVKENSRANQLLADDKHIKEILILDRTKNNTGAHDGLSGFYKLSKDLKLKKFDKVFDIPSFSRATSRYAQTNVFEFFRKFLFSFIYFFTINYKFWLCRYYLS